MATARAEYDTAHRHVVAAKGPASHKPCAFCGTFAADWCYSHLDPAEIYRDGYLWSDSTAHYMPLCKKHHQDYDRAFRQHGKAALPVFAESLREACQATYEERRQVVEARSENLWRVRERVLAEKREHGIDTVPREVIHATHDLLVRAYGFRHVQLRMQ
ncbi:hypothetical protein [Streptomyces mangrovisoli]|uniref:hypothetical protein n=1 Tax=Streptomyces mangrovisoli TaxID=1428628 RepID=UPI001160B7B0|nr:hypothetical protein [Streptomyces mangrovisoli]